MTLFSIACLCLLVRDFNLVRDHPKSLNKCYIDFADKTGISGPSCVTVNTLPSVYALVTDENHLVLKRTEIRQYYHYSSNVTQLSECDF